MARIAVLGLALTVSCATPAPAPEIPAPAPAAPKQIPTDLRALRERIAALEARSADLLKKSHEALDRGDYDAAAALHRESTAAARSADEARGGEAALVTAAARDWVADLDHDDIERRERATQSLVALGAAPDLLRKLSTGLSKEGVQRLNAIIRVIEEPLFPRQWASGATASTEYGRPQWCATQATGPPDTPMAGDFSTAWASKLPDADGEWLALTFDAAVEPAMIRVHETYNPGAIVKVEARDAAGAWRTVWEGAAMAADAPRWFEVRVDGATWTTNEVRLTLDSAAVAGWNEIDTVELVGRVSRKAAR